MVENSAKEVTMFFWKGQSLQGQVKFTIYKITVVQFLLYFQDFKQDSNSGILFSEPIV